MQSETICFDTIIDIARARIRIEHAHLNGTGKLSAVYYVLWDTAAALHTMPNGVRYIVVIGIEHNIRCFIVLNFGAMMPKRRRRQIEEVMYGILDVCTATA